MIHKEGRNPIVITLFLLIIVYFGVDFISKGNVIAERIVLSISLIVFFLILQFFRNPNRKLKSIDNHVVLAPADGKIVVIKKVFEPEYFKDEKIQVSIFMSPLNVHVNRNPISGIVKYFKYHPGKYLVAWHPKASTKNERTTMVLERNDGSEILVRQIAGAVAKRIRWYVKQGQPIIQGQDFGFIKFGSRVDLFLPLDADIKVKLNQKSIGNRTQIATF